MNPSPRWTKQPDLDAKIDALQVGKRYMIIWTNDSRRTDRMSVLKFLGHNSVARVNDDTSWDARPDAGTQTMPRSWILWLEPAADDAKIVIDEKAPVPGNDQDADWTKHFQHCGRRMPHEAHVTRMSREQRWKLWCPGEQDLTKSASTGVRWQAQMEEHLRETRTLSNEAMRLLTLPTHAQDAGVQHNTRQRVELAKAHANAALALALANGLGDLEVPLSTLAATVAEAKQGLGTI